MQHNPQSRAYFAIVMSAIVVCFVIALTLLHGGASDAHKTKDHDTGHKAEASGYSHGEAKAVPSSTKMGGSETGEEGAPQKH